MAVEKDTTLTVLREIRDEIRATNARLGYLELGMLGLAEQQRFVVRCLQAGSERDHRFEHDLAALRARVEALEARRQR